MLAADRTCHIFFQFFRRFWAMVSDMFRFTLPVVFVVPMTALKARCAILFGLFDSPLSPFSKIGWKLDLFHGLPRSFCEPAPAIG